mgnify:CR=1 FL=1|jgi:hypothetical protein
MQLEYSWDTVTVPAIKAPDQSPLTTKAKNFISGARISQ